MPGRDRVSDQKERCLTGRYACIQCFFWMGFATVMGFASVFLLDVGFTNTQIGLVIALSGGASALLQPIAAAAAEGGGRFGLKAMIAVFSGAVVLAGLGLTALYLLEGPAVAVGLLYGACLLLLQLDFPLINALGTEAVDQGHRLDWGAARGIGSVAYAAAAGALGFLTKSLGAVAVPLLILVSFSLTAVSVPSFPLEARQKAAERGAGGTASPLVFFRTYPRFGVLLIGTTLLYSGHMILNNFTFQIVVSKGGGSGEMGIATALAAFWELPTMFLFGAMVERVRCHIWLRLSAVFFTAKAALSWLVPSIPLFYAVQSLQMLGWALISVASVYYVDTVLDRGDAIKGQAYLTMTFTLGSVLGALAGGRMLDLVGADVLLPCISAVSALGTVVTIAGAQSPRPDRR